MDQLEPVKIAEAVKKLNLKHVVITSVDRDDLDDGGSEHFYETINQTRKQNPNTTIEVLTPDFLRKGDAYKRVLDANPDVFNHNIETVPSLYLKVRPGSRYFSSLELLKNAKKVNKPINPIKKKPDWIRSKLSNSKEFFLTKTVVNQNNLVTVCQEANCPILLNAGVKDMQHL